MSNADMFNKWRSDVTSMLDRHFEEGRALGRLEGVLYTVALQVVVVIFWNVILPVYR